MEAYIRTLEILENTTSDNNVFINFLKSKLFLLKDESIHKLLLKTKNNITNKKLPFNPMFIDCFQKNKLNTLNKITKEVKYEEFYFNGFYLQEEPKTNSFMIFSILEYPQNFKTKEIPIHRIGFSVYDYGLSDNEIKERAKQLNVNYKSLKIMLNGLAEYICNFLDFINNPEVEIVTVERTKEQNTKRISKGKLPIPPINHIRVNGKLKKYIDNLSSGSHLSYSHRFWVRGHFRTLRDENRYGDKAGTKRWILPYIKGQGILIEKQYEVSGDSSHD